MNSNESRAYKKPVDGPLHA